MNKKINIAYLYFLLPLIFFPFINFSRETDIWFILSHGRYILNNGFPHMEFLTIHNGLHFVMQQWGFSFVMYILYHYIGSIGVVTFIGIINISILFILYKFCMKINNNKYFSCLISSLIDLLLMLNFIILRPQMISLLILLIVIYILERKDGSIYFLPLLSLLLINSHASMWLMLFILFMPFIVEYILKKDKYVFKLLIIIAISFFIGFINPYGLEAMFYSFNSYGINIINELVVEMKSFSFSGEKSIVFNSILFFIIFLLLIISFIFNRKRYSIHSIFLILGLSLMTFLNLRNIALFLVGAFPYIIIFFKKDINCEINIKYLIVCIIFIICLFSYSAYNGNFILKNNMSEIVDFFDKNCNKKYMILYNEFDDGPYLEYHGYKTYIDTRAEVFIKKVNNKSDILNEYYDVLSGNIDYNKFLNKYGFTHLIVYKNSYIYRYLNRNSNYKNIFNKDNDIYVFERVNLFE